MDPGRFGYQIPLPQQYGLCEKTILIDTVELALCAVTRQPPQAVETGTAIVQWNHDNSLPSICSDARCIMPNYPSVFEFPFSSIEVEVRSTYASSFESYKDLPSGNMWIRDLFNPNFTFTMVNNGFQKKQSSKNLNEHSELLTLRRTYTALQTHKPLTLQQKQKKYA